MLERLTVRDFALIERLEVSFAPGLNVLTGETGAGKSILVGALGLLLGQKAGPDTVRAGAEEAIVAGIVRVAGSPEALGWLERRGIALDDDSVILRRNVKPGGRGSIYVQSVPVSRVELAELAGLLFDLHGQHEHQSLLQPDVHRSYLDRFGGFEQRAAAFGDLFHRLAAARERLSHLVTDERERARRVELLEHSVREIREARLEADEDKELEKERNVLAHAEQLSGLLDRAYEGTAEARGGALASLRIARRALDEASAIDPELVALGQGVESAFYEVEDLAEQIGRRRDGIAFDAARLEEVEQRLATIRALERKYGDTVAEVVAYGERCQADLASLERGEAERSELEKEVAGLEREVVHAGEALSASRREAAKRLEGRIERELGGLGMGKSGFSVGVAPRLGAEGKAVYGPSGKDVVEFLISPNVGEPFRKLASIASGGEISRVMLAIKSVLADQDSIDTLIFDEVDVGIGGEVALAVGTKLRELSESKQVLCITHLATIAVRAGSHLRVEKQVRDGRTVTEVRSVQGEDRVAEVARMLAGDRSSEVSLEHARELLGRYGSDGTEGPAIATRGA
jgi:DNA repair protein RecN (Recombination protein N)